SSRRYSRGRKSSAGGGRWSGRPVRLRLLVGEQPEQALLDADLRLPAEHLPRLRDVGLPDLWIVHGERLEDDLAARADQLLDELRELEQCPLLRVADVDREMLAALCEQHESPDQIVDVTEAASLGAGPEDRQRLVLERLADECRHRAAVVRPHARTVRVEDADDCGVNPLLAV